MTTGDVGRRLQEDVRATLRAAADPSKAAPMQAYMKSAMPYYGVPSPARRVISRAVRTRHPFDDRARWERAIRRLWDEAEHREERYVAIDLTDRRPWQDAGTIPLYRHLIVTGAWWDFVDEVAIRRVGPILRADPIPVGATLRAWAVEEDLWLRRSAIIAQVGSKSATDTALLTEVIDANLGDHALERNFFIRKGIGWALREHAKTDPQWVRAFVDARTGRLSALSIKEATKHLGG
jgi:3-methyladenine DNA glycosylase AlkD